MKRHILAIWLGLSACLSVQAQEDEGDHPYPKPLVVVTTTQERLTAQSFIEAANKGESEGALRDRIVSARFVFRKRGALLFAFSPMVVVTQADYDLQALTCLLTTQKPMECPTLRSWLENAMRKRLEHLIELEEMDRSAEIIRLDGFTPDMTPEKLVTECNPSVQFVADIWVTTEFTPVRGTPRYRLASVPLTGWQPPQTLLRELQQTVAELPSYKAWRERENEYLFLMSDVVTGELRSTMLKTATEMLRELHAAAEKRVQRLKDVIAQEVQRRSGIPRGTFVFKDLPPEMQQKMREIHRQSPIFEWMKEEKPPEDALTRTRFEFEITPLIRTTFDCPDKGHRYWFSVDIGTPEIPQMGRGELYVEPKQWRTPNAP